jgi:ATP-dependent DNA helicase RecG
MDLDGLPINLDDLLHGRSIESNRIEFKATWSEPTKAQVARTVCAFANDLLNLGGGYVVLGVAEEQGRAVLPPVGLRDVNLERLQKEIRGACQKIEPAYQPLVSAVLYRDVPIVVLFAPGGDTRPYQAPEDVNAKASPRHYYVRRGPETIQANGDTRRQLFEAAAKVPFDDRRNLEARVEDISPLLVRRFLHEIQSDLLNSAGSGAEHQIYRQMNLLVKVNAHEVPRNVALLFFNEDPDRFFRGARTEVVQFGDDAGGDLLEERVFRGPLSTQIQDSLRYLDSLGGTLVQKIPGYAEVERTVPYPYSAMEEAIANALYHRSYEGPPEPVKIYLFPDRMEITSYPGPVPGIQRQHFEPGHTLPPVPARNRRIGDLLKELRLAEGRGTGIPKIRRRMRENGSPEARFDFDEERTYFRVTLPVHPRYEVLNALRRYERQMKEGRGVPPTGS